MKTIVHRADSRGHTNHGWLDSWHSFSFGSFYDIDRMHFGVLRVLNDDTVDPGKGFATHPHNNMEIISIPLEGDLEHKDSMGNTSVIKKGDIQVMSAGTGIRHSEYNRNNDRHVKFLQIWIFPKARDLKPRYDQISMESLKEKNSFYQVLSPSSQDQGVWIHQDAWIHMGQVEKGISLEYDLKKKGNGLYLFVIDGKLSVDGIQLTSRDAMGISEADKVSFHSESESNLLLLDVPMNL